MRYWDREPNTDLLDFIRIVTFAYWIDGDTLLMLIRKRTFIGERSFWVGKHLVDSKGEKIVEWNLLASCKIVPLEFRQREGNFRNLRKMRWKFKYYGEKVKQLWEHLSRRKKLCGGTMFETYFEGNSCEEKLNSSKLSALRRIEWFPLEFSFSFFSLHFFFFFDIGN